MLAFEHSMENRVRYRKLLELLFVFGVLPLVLQFRVFPKPWFLYLYVAAIPVLLWLKFSRHLGFTLLWRGRHAGPQVRSVREVLSRFGIVTILLSVFTLFAFPDKLLGLPGDQPMRWIAVLVLYPLVAVYPQELFFRTFFLERYGDLFASRSTRIICNAMCFGWAHILFGNWIAVVLSTLGGILLADTYEKTGSLRIVCLEHALYGNLVFTIGLGEFFYSGWAG